MTADLEKAITAILQKRFVRLRLFFCFAIGAVVSLFRPSAGAEYVALADIGRNSLIEEQVNRLHNR